jgi:class 3 adenylate cyclase
MDPAEYVALKNALLQIRQLIIDPSKPLEDHPVNPAAVDLSEYDLVAVAPSTAVDSGSFAVNEPKANAKSDGEVRLTSGAVRQRLDSSLSDEGTPPNQSSHADSRNRFSLLESLTVQPVIESNSGPILYDSSNRRTSLTRVPSKRWDEENIVIPRSSLADKLEKWEEELLMDETYDEDVAEYEDIMMEKFKHLQVRSALDELLGLALDEKATLLEAQKLWAVSVLKAVSSCAMKISELQNVCEYMQDRGSAAHESNEAREILFDSMRLLLDTFMQVFEPVGSDKKLLDRYMVQTDIVWSKLLEVIQIVTNQNNSERENRREMMRVLEDQILALKKQMDNKDKTISYLSAENERIGVEMYGAMNGIDFGADLPLMEQNGIIAPRGSVTICFTDVQQSTELWESHEAEMEIAVKLHNAKIRECIQTHGGYEVKTEGDAFMVAFSSPIAAIKWAIDIQKCLLVEEWPAAMLETATCAIQYTTPEEMAEFQLQTPLLIWRGLRVRCGIHSGFPICSPDPTTSRMDYFGPMVNRTARIGSMALGGQTLVSSSLFDNISSEDFIRHDCITRQMGEYVLKGISTPESLVEIQANVLAARKLPKVDTAKPVESEGFASMMAMISAAEEKASSLIDAGMIDMDALGEADSNAPKGEVVLVFTDVENSTKLWENFTGDMERALELHNDLMRLLIAEHNGYEVKTEGDAFMIAFQDPLDAVRWMLACQCRLTAVDWPHAMLSCAECQTVLTLPDQPDSQPLWRGLRVRMGAHMGFPICTPDPLTKRMDYFGPMVNRAARVAGAAHGGQVVVSRRLWMTVRTHLMDIGDPFCTALGEHQFKGLNSPELIVEMLPKMFMPRSAQFPPVRSSAEGSTQLEELMAKLEQNEKSFAQLAAARKTMEQEEHLDLSQVSKKFPSPQSLAHANAQFLADSNRFSLHDYMHQESEHRAMRVAFFFNRIYILYLLRRIEVEVGDTPDENQSLLISLGFRYKKLKEALSRLDSDQHAMKVERDTNIELLLGQIGPGGRDAMVHRLTQRGKGGAAGVLDNEDGDDGMGASSLGLKVDPRVVKNNRMRRNPKYGGANLKNAKDKNKDDGEGALLGKRLKG